MEHKNTFICIDLKSFYASVECVERGLDPLTTNLAVADPNRSKSTICLAITPAMKRLGIRNRCRLHEIPAHIEYITAVPRMQLYIDYSSKIYSIYLKHVAREDIHVYSIDESFLDITNYLNLYGICAKEFASRLMNDVFKETGITATVGIGSNLYLAKVALDIVAKHSPDYIGILDEYSYRTKLWSHQPLSDFWRIGSKTAYKLAGYGIYTMGDIARMSITSQDWLYKIFGIDAELLIDHAWGLESCRMCDIKNYHSREHSLSTGQVLMRNYSFEEAVVVVKEMTDLLVLDLVSKNLITDSLSLRIAYDHKYEKPSSHGTIKLDYPTNSSKLIISSIEKLYHRIVDSFCGIRRIEICACKVRTEDYIQYNLFMNPQDTEKEKNLQNAITSIHKRYGKNAIMRGYNLLDYSTYRTRNGQIGGHKA